MLIVRLFRVSIRTFRVFFGKRAEARLRHDADAIVVARTGLYSTPASIGMLTGALSAAVNLLPASCFGWSYANSPLLFSLIIFITLSLICSGPYLLTLSAKSLFGLVRFTFWLSLGALLPLFLIYQARSYFIYRSFYSISAVFRVGASFLIGRHLARNYGALKSLNRCGLLCIVGNLPMIGFEIFLAWNWEFPKLRHELTREQLAFFVTAFLISQIGVATLPALASEKEFRQRLAESQEKLTAAQPSPAS